MPSGQSLMDSAKTSCELDVKVHFYKPSPRRGRRVGLSAGDTLMQLSWGFRRRKWGVDAARKYKEEENTLSRMKKKAVRSKWEERRYLSSQKAGGLLDKGTRADAYELVKTRQEMTAHEKRSAKGTGKNQLKLLELVPEMLGRPGIPEHRESTPSSRESLRNFISTWDGRKFQSKARSCSKPNFAIKQNVTKRILNEIRVTGANQVFKQ